MANQGKLGETTFSVGDNVKVYFGPENPFQGTVIAIRGEGENKTFTVRRVGTGRIGIERIFPLSSPLLTKIEVKKKGEVRRAKLYYLRKQTKK